VGLEWFRPDRSASIIGNSFGPDAKYDGNGLENFFIPQVGYTHVLNDDWAVGVAIYGNGGLNTHYKVNPFGRFGSTGVAGVNLSQLFVSPTVNYRLTEGHTIGVGVNLAYQLFKAEGIGAFAGSSSNPAAFTNRETDDAFGYGARIGYLGQLTPELSVGAFWQSKTYSGRFKKYAGLFAEQGDFDVPSTYGIGLAYKITPDLDVAADLTRIEYSGVDSVGNSLGQLFLGNPFGADAGPGFGWRDVTIVKVGANYRIDPHWQVRAGWNYTTQPVRESQTLLNVLAPGVVQHQYTAGATWTTADGLEVSGFVLYAPKEEVDGSGSIPVPFGGGEANIELSEFSIGLALGWRL
jgi:long-chain fatty acid transport protein